MKYDIEVEVKVEVEACQSVKQELDCPSEYCSEFEWSVGVIDSC